MCPGVPEWSEKKGEYRYKNGCASDFDYRGWYIYASRREALNSEMGIEQRGCSSNCFHPSECRWNSEQLAIRAKKYDECKKAANNGDKLNEATSHADGLPGMPLERRSVDASDQESESEDQVQTTSGTEPQAPNSRIALLEPTVTFTVRAKATSEADRKSSAGRRTERKTKRQRKIIPPLSPIKEEVLSPVSQNAEEQVRRPVLRLANSLEISLNSTEKDNQCLNGVSKEDEASLEALGMVDDVDIPHLPLTSSRTENKISRPVLTFTTHFIDFLGSQSRHCFLPEIEPLEDLPDFNKMDLDDPVSPNQAMCRISSPIQRVNDSLPMHGYDSLETAHWSKVDDLLKEHNDVNDDSAFPSTHDSWDETLEGIGIALGHPPQATEDHIWGEEMEIR